MKDTLIIGAAILVAIAIGAWLMVSDSAPAAVPTTGGSVTFSVLQEGDNAGELDERKNYRIKTQEELDQLWTIVGQGGAPAVDFATSEVLAAFDGIRPTGGYFVRIASVEDTSAARRVVIEHTAPGAGCMTTSALTSPFTMVVVPKTDLPIARVDVEKTEDCE